MLGFGWSEMLVIGIVALIVIGPKDLPVVMGRIGKIVGQIRRMGSEFQREINKTAGLDEIRNLRSSITDPLKKSSEEIRKEFNAMTSAGVKPTGVIKPADPKVESVVDEIRAAAGMSVAPAAVLPVAAEAKGLKANPPPKKPPARAKAVPNSSVVATELQALDVTAPAKAVKIAKPAAKPTTQKPAVDEPTKATSASSKATTSPAKPMAVKTPAANKRKTAKDGVK